MAEFVRKVAKAFTETYKISKTFIRMYQSYLYTAMSLVYKTLCLITLLYPIGVL